MKTIVPYSGPLAHLKDLIFENLPEGEAQAWYGRFMSAIESGLDHWSVWYRWVAATLREDLQSLSAVKANPKVLSSIQRVTALYDDAANGIQIEDIDWETAINEANAAWRTTKEKRASTAAWATGWMVMARKAKMEEVRMATNAVASAAWTEDLVWKGIGDAAWAEERHRLYRRLGDRLIGVIQLTKRSARQP